MPVPGYDVELRDATGRLVPDGEPGALHVRGESIALGYWHRTDATRQVFQGEWLVTGDTYVRNAEGYYTCLGRNSDMLKAGGIWVSPGEVESRLLEHPAVREAAVVGVARRRRPRQAGRGRGGRPDSGLHEADLVAWCRDGLAHFKAPRKVVFVDRPAEDRDRQAAALQGPRPRRPRPRRRAGAPRRPTSSRWPRERAVEVDMLIVGAGPVGLYGAYYAGVRGLSVAVVDSLSEVGGQVTAMYPEKQIYDVAGFPAVSGRDLVRGLVAQAAAAATRRTCSARRPSSSRTLDDGRLHVTTSSRHGGHLRRAGRHRRHRHVHARGRCRPARSSSAAGWSTSCPAARSTSAATWSSSAAATAPSTGR